MSLPLLFYAPGDTWALSGSVTCTATLYGRLKEGNGKMVEVVFTGNTDAVDPHGIIVIDGEKYAYTRMSKETDLPVRIRVRLPGSGSPDYGRWNENTLAYALNAVANGQKGIVSVSFLKSPFSPEPIPIDPEPVDL